VLALLICLGKTMRFRKVIESRSSP